MAPEKNKALVSCGHYLGPQKLNCGHYFN